MSSNENPTSMRYVHASETAEINALDSCSSNSAGTTSLLHLAACHAH